MKIKKKLRKKAFEWVVIYTLEGNAIVEPLGKN